MNEIILHPGQSRIFSDIFVEKVARNFVAVCSRGWGKSYFAGTCAANAVFELLSLSPRIPNKNVYIIAPTYSQVTDIYYPLMADILGMKKHCIKPPSRDLGRFQFQNGVELQLCSYEAVERLRGSGAYFVVNDEVRDWTKGMGHKEAWQGILQPCIATRWSPQRAKSYHAPAAGRSLTISTTKGYNYLYDLYNLQEQDKDWKSYQFDYTTSPFLDPIEIEKLRHTLDPVTFAREYLASFEESGNKVFYCFDRKKHVVSDLQPLQDHEDVHIGIDFNVSKQCSSMFVVRGGQVHYLDEFYGLPDTEQLAIAIKGRYAKTVEGRKRRIYVYPDPSGRARKTSAAVGVTDFSILESHGLITCAHKKAPPIVDSVACVNRLFRTAAGECNVYVSSKCQGIIGSLERTSWVDNNLDTATIDKSQDIEHFSDSIRYPMEYLFPIQTGKKVVSRGFGF